MTSTLAGTDRALASCHDVALLDLDGVVYIGADAVPGVPAALAATREQGLRLAFVTNNAARTPFEVADHLTRLGVAAKADEVITSAQAAARYLADRLPGGARVLVVGTTGLQWALRERGLTPIAEASGQVDAVVQGYSPDLTWALLAEGAVALNGGVRWVATNADPTVPSARGPLPGNGSTVEALRRATGREPIVTGKPDPTMHRETLIRTGADRPVVVGDRLDTDIEGANAVGCPSLLVLSGVTGIGDLLTAPATHRPTYLGDDAAALLVAHPAVEASSAGAQCRGWTARWRDDRIEVLAPGSGGANSGPSVGGAAGSGTGAVAGAGTLDALRAICGAVWSRYDDAPPGAPVLVGDGSEATTAALKDLGLSDGSDGSEGADRSG